MNISVQDLIALATVLLPLLIPLGGALYKHMVDALPSNQRQAVVDTVKIATQAIASDPTIAVDAETAAATLLKEMHLPSNPNLVKSLVAIFRQDTGQAAPKNDAETEIVHAQTVGFAPPTQKSEAPNPGL
jgi:hypothetical protein